MKTPTGPKHDSGRAEHLRRAAHLRDAILKRAQEQGQTPADLARVMDMSVGHWYRIKKEPARLGRLTLERLNAISEYVGWTRVQVMVAVGWLQASELDEVLAAESVTLRALQRLEQSGLANSLTTPLARAAADHRLLMARLLLAAEAAVAASE